MTATVPKITQLGSVDVTSSDSFMSGTLIVTHTLANGYTYTAAAPVVNSITPTGGGVAGGDPITISGAHFASGATVTIGGNAATGVTVVRSTLITATVPAGVAGPADVVVTNTDSQFGTLSGGYTYFTLRPPENPAVTQPGLQFKYYLNASTNGVVPNLTPLLATSSGIITTNPVFNLSQREFDNNYAMAYTGYLDIPADDTYTFTTDSDDGARLLIGTTLVVDANFNQGQGIPETGNIDLAAGRHAFRLEYAQGNGGFGLAVRFKGTLMATPVDLSQSINLFTCDPSPTVTLINPPSGGSNAAVTITGTGFVAGATVGFNGSAASQVVVVNSTTITCNVPSNPAGASSVVVTNPNGSSGTLLNTTLFDGFTFTGGLRAPEFATSTGFQNAMFFKYYTNGNQTLPSNTPDAIENLTPFSTGLFLKGKFTPQQITEGPTQFNQVGNGNMLSPRTSDLNIFFRYNFYVNAPVAGTYTFGTSSDDGSLLFVGSTLVVNSNFGQGVTDRSGPIDLDVGLHRITVLFGEGGGGFGLSVRYQKPGDPGLAFIPDTEIFVDPTPTVTAATPSVPSSTGGAITITGSNFLPGATVQVGNTHIIDVTVVNSTTLTCVVPPGDPGTATLTVINPIGVSGSGDVLHYFLPATQFEVVAPANAVAGTPFSVTVNALDGNGNIDLAYVGTVDLSSLDVIASFSPSSYTFTAGDAGSHTFTNGVTLGTAGVDDVTATDDVNGSITGFADVSVTAGPVSNFSVSGFTQPATAGTANAITVSALDDFGNVNLSYTGTIVITSSDSQAILPGPFTFSPSDNGTHTLSLILVSSGTQTITVADQSFPLFTGSTTVTIDPDVAVSLAVSGFPDPFNTGTSGNYSVTALDRFGNVATGYTGTIIISTGDTLAAFTGGTFDGLSGVLNLSGTFNTPGTWNLTATDSVTLSITGTQFGIDIGTAQSQTITFGPLSNKVFGATPFTVSATASSGLPVSFSVTGPAFISGTTVTLTGVGTVNVIASQAGNSTFSAAPDVTQSFVVSRGNQTISFPTPTGVTFGDDPFVLSATATSGLPVSYSIISGGAFVILNGDVITVVGAGDVTLQADQVGNANYFAATLQQVTFTVAKESQSISFGTLFTKTFGDPPFALTATASSGLPVSYSATGPATVLGNTLTITGSGIVTVFADQAGDANFLAAPQQSQIFAVGREAQLITFAQLPDVTFGVAPFELTATASSGLPVSYGISGPATLNGDIVTITGAGSVTITADQAGDGNFQAAPQVPNTFNVAKNSQTITFAAPATPVTFGVPPFELTATASSGLPVAYTVTGPATLNGSIVTITGVGTITLKADQSGNANFNAAPQITRTVVVNQNSQTITFNTLPGATFGDAPFNLTATSDSGLPVSYAVTAGNATVNGTLVTITGTGLVTIQATQAGNANISAAAPVSKSFSVAKANQTITFVALGNKVFGDSPFTVSATSTSGLAVTFGIVSGPATIAGNTITITGGGTVVVSADQIGNANFNAATQVTQSFNVATSGQTIAFAALPDKVFGDAPIVLSATASSGLAVSFSVVSGPASIAGSTLTITGAGVVVVRASQPGNASFGAAPDVDQNFTVAKATPVITWANPADIVVGTALGST